VGEALERPLSFVAVHARICSCDSGPARPRPIEGGGVLFVIIGRDGPDAKELRPRLRPAHLAHLCVYDRQGRVHVAGPLTDGAGSLIIVEADTIEDVRRIADADPYVTGGVFATVEIHPFLQVLPAPVAKAEDKSR
jgi:uncharacterized protein